MNMLLAAGGFVLANAIIGVAQGAIAAWRDRAEYRKKAVATELADVFADPDAWDVLVAELDRGKAERKSPPTSR